MKNCRLFLTFMLLAVVLAACASETPAAVPVQTELAQQPSSTPSLAPVRETPAVDLTATYTLELLSATPPSDALPVATSRGPDLHATDPSTVSLSAGQLQLVEFFRFT